MDGWMDGWMYELMIVAHENIACKGIGSGGCQQQDSASKTQQVSSCGILQALDSRLDEGARNSEVFKDTAAAALSEAASTLSEGANGLRCELDGVNLFEDQEKAQVPQVGR
eukprot:scaffold145904_cov36-Prasinocladus_malaysianus.AAC.1